MNRPLFDQPDVARRERRRATAQGDELPVIRARILGQTSEVRILDPDLCRALIRERQERDIDKHDEVWDGVYVVPPLANNPHQDLATAFAGILFHVIALEGRGRVLAGATVSDRRQGWEHNYRAPDVVVELPGSRAVDCTTHWQGGPDFLIEIQSPRAETEEKIPFYSARQVQELLIVQ